MTPEQTIELDLEERETPASDEDVPRAAERVECDQCERETLCNLWAPPDAPLGEAVAWCTFCQPLPDGYDEAVNMVPDAQRFVATLRDALRDEVRDAVGRDPLAQAYYDEARRVAERAGKNHARWSEHALIASMALLIVLEGGDDHEVMLRPPGDDPLDGEEE